jgi:hypothetical protein
MYILLVSAYFVAVKMVTTILSIIQYSGCVGTGWNIPDSCVCVSLDATISLGRFQILDEQQAQALGFSKARVILDGGTMHLSCPHDDMQRLIKKCTYLF